MNYYLSNGLTTVEPESFSYVVSTPKLMNYQMFNDKCHDELVRCKECGIKYDMHVLKCTSLGKFVCKYCLNKGTV